MSNTVEELGIKLIVDDSQVKPTLQKYKREISQAAAELKKVFDKNLSIEKIDDKAFNATLQKIEKMRKNLDRAFKGNSNPLSEDSLKKTIKAINDYAVQYQNAYDTAFKNIVESQKKADAKMEAERRKAQRKREADAKKEANNRLKVETMAAQQSLSTQKKIDRLKNQSSRSNYEARLKQINNELLQEKNLHEQKVKYIKAYGALQKEIQDEINRTNSENQSKNQTFWGKLTGRAQGGFMSGLGSMLGLVTRGNIAFSIVNGFKEMVKGSYDLSKSMTQLQVMTKSTDAQMYSLTHTMNELAGQFGYTSDESMKFFTSIARLGVGAEHLDKIAKASAAVAKATGGDLEKTGELLVTTMNAFNMEYDKAEYMADRFVATLNSSALDINKFNTIMSYVAASGEAVGVSFEKASAMISVLANSGLKASQIGTSLRNIFSELVNKGVQVDDVIQQLKDGALTYADAVELVGTRGANALKILVDKWDDVEKAQEKAFNSLTTSSDQAMLVVERNFVNRLMNSFGRLGTSIKSIFAGLVTSSDEKTIKRVIKDYQDDKKTRKFFGNGILGGGADEILDISRDKARAGARLLFDQYSGKNGINIFKDSKENIMSGFRKYVKDDILGGEVDDKILDELLFDIGQDISKQQGVFYHNVDVKEILSKEYKESGGTLDKQYIKNRYQQLMEERGVANSMQLRDESYWNEIMQYEELKPSKQEIKNMKSTDFGVISMVLKNMSKKAEYDKLLGSAKGVISRTNSGIAGTADYDTQKAIRDSGLLELMGLRGNLTEQELNDYLGSSTVTGTLQEMRQLADAIRSEKLKGLELDKDLDKGSWKYKTEVMKVEEEYSTVIDTINKFTEDEQTKFFAFLGGLSSSAKSIISLEETMNTMLLEFDKAIEAQAEIQSLNELFKDPNILKTKKGRAKVQNALISARNKSNELYTANKANLSTEEQQLLASISPEGIEEYRKSGQWLGTYDLNGQFNESAYVQAQQKKLDSNRQYQVRLETAKTSSDKQYDSKEKQMEDERIKQHDAAVDVWGGISQDALGTAIDAYKTFNDIMLQQTLDRINREIEAENDKANKLQGINSSLQKAGLISAETYAAEKERIDKENLEAVNNLNEKAFEQQKKAQKQEATINYTQKLAEMAINVLVANSKQGVLGIATAPAVIAAYTAIASAQYAVQMAAIGKQKFVPQKYEKGGYVEGASHAQGGIPISVNGDIREMEGGEFIVNKRATAKHLSLLNAINDTGKYADGGYVSPKYSSTISNDQVSISQGDSLNLEMVKLLTELRNNPIKAYVRISDIEQGNELREINRNRFTI